LLLLRWGLSVNFFSKLVAYLSGLNRIVLIAGGVGGVAVIGGAAYLAMNSVGADAPAEVAKDIAEGNCKPITTVSVTDEDYIIGDKAAPITLVEYLSQTCSHCAQFRNEEIPKVEDAYVKSGLVRIIFRELHRNNVDVAASVLGRCLGRDAYLPFTDMLLQQQAVWMMREDGDVVAGLRDIARRAGMSSADFDACLKKQDLAKELVKQSTQAAKDYCISGTPTLILNGKKLEGTATTFENLSTEINAELKKIGKAVPAAAATATPAAAATPAEGAPVEGATTTPAAEPAAAPAEPAPSAAEPAPKKPGN